MTDRPDQPDDDTTPTAAPRDGVRRAATLVLAVVVVVLLAGFVARVALADGSVGERFGALYADDAEARETADVREVVMNQANQFALRVNTYGPADLDGNGAMPEYAERVREVITDQFAVGFDQSVTLAEQTVNQAGYGRTAELYATGVETLDDANATVILSGAFTSSYPDSREEGRVEVEPLPFRWRVQLVRTQGEWLVDGYSVVGADDTGTGGTGEVPTDPAPSQTPGQTPGQTPSGQPSGTPGGQPSGTPSGGAGGNSR